MRAFLETRFGPTELALLDEVFKQWIAQAQLAKDSPEAELAAAVMINLFREGHTTIPSLTEAMARHQGLSGLTALAS